jgi:hypothetical protein
MSGTGKVKGFGLVPGKRSYECEVLGTRENVSLSSRSLAGLYTSGSCQPSQEHSDISLELCHESAGSDGKAQQREDTPSADVHNCHSRVPTATCARSPISIISSPIETKQSMYNFR